MMNVILVLTGAIKTFSIDIKIINRNHVKIPRVGNCTLNKSIHIFRAQHSCQHPHRPVYDTDRDIVTPYHGWTNFP